MMHTCGTTRSSRLFADPDGDSHNYLEIEINALNTVLNLLKASRQGTAYWDWNPRFDSAVHIEGSLNDPSDQDQSWSVQMAMPWSAFESDLLDVPGERSPPTPSLAPPRATVTRVNWIA